MPCGYLASSRLLLYANSSFIQVQPRKTAYGKCSPRTAFWLAE